MKPIKNTQILKMLKIVIAKQKETEVKLILNHSFIILSSRWR